MFDQDTQRLVRIFQKVFHLSYVERDQVKSPAFLVCSCSLRIAYAASRDYAKANMTICRKRHFIWLALLRMLLRRERDWQRQLST